MRLPRKRGKAAVFSLLAVIVVYPVLRWGPLPMDPGSRQDSAAYLASDGSLLRLRLSRDGKYRLPLKLEDMAPPLVNGFVAYEDRHFYGHPGFNPASLLRALWLNARAGHVVSGGSTITMQLARLINPRPRTYAAKTLELFRALQLECRYTKNQILEFYLNRVPMGGNIEGIGAASYLYFGRPARDLSLAEAALLVSLPRSPNARRPDLHPGRAVEKRNEVLERIAGPMGLEAAQAREAASAGVPEGRRENPDRAAQLVGRMDRALGRPSGPLRLSVDPSYQGAAEALLARTAAALANRGIHNGAVLIVDNATMKVLAYVGSADPLSSRGGAINGADILRSPGSALKPFLYGLAIDRGEVTPKLKLSDLPRDFGGFKPSNYEGFFSGLIRARDALAKSLNLPAVDLESRMKEKGGGLRFLLAKAGFYGRGRERLDPGLSLVLGAYPMTLEEMVTLYAALAHGGLWRPLSFGADPEISGPEVQKRLFSEAAAYLVADMLSEVRRPDLPASWEFSPTRARVAFKTGTSFGFRDAWCLGFTPELTIGVWLGNVDAAGSSGLMASETAAPLVLELFHQFTRSRDSWFRAPSGLDTRKVCSLTGKPPGDFCPSTELDFYIPGTSQEETCSVHKKTLISGLDGAEVCFACVQPEEPVLEKVIALWPPDIQWYLRTSGQARDRIPVHRTSCPRRPRGAAPRITSPQNGGRYELDAGKEAGGQKLALSVQASQGTVPLYWFLGDFLIGESASDKPFFWSPRPGRFRMTVVDSEGRSSSVSFTVAAPKPNRDPI